MLWAFIANNAIVIESEASDSLTYRSKRICALCNVIRIVTYTSPLKTNTHCRRLGLYTRYGLRDRIDPNVAINAYCKYSCTWHADPFAKKVLAKLSPEIINGFLDMINHIGACLSPRHEWRHDQIKILPPPFHYEHLIFFVRILCKCDTSNATVIGTLNSLLILFLTFLVILTFKWQDQDNCVTESALAVTFWTCNLSKSTNYHSSLILHSEYMTLTYHC